MQITEALISEPGKSGVLFSRRWTTGQICWHFTSRSIRQKESMVNRFRHFVVPFTDGYTERITEHNHTVSPSALVVLRWLREQHEGAQIRCLLLLSQTSICHPRVGVMADEECAQLVDLLQQTWSVISAGGQCRVERCFRVARPGSSGQYVVLKTAVQSFMSQVIATIIR